MGNYYSHSIESVNISKTMSLELDHQYLGGRVVDTGISVKGFFWCNTFKCVEFQRELTELVKKYEVDVVIQKEAPGV